MVCDEFQLAVARRSTPMGAGLVRESWYMRVAFGGVLRIQLYEWMLRLFTEEEEKPSSCSDPTLGCDNHEPRLVTPGAKK